MDVRRCSVAEIEAAPNFEGVLAEYGRECAMEELGRPECQIETYRLLERNAAMHPIAAFQGAVLAGFVLPIVVVLPHYGATAATIESIFVPEKFRKFGVFGQLRAIARQHCRDLGAKALIWSAPVGSVFADVLHLEASRGICRHSNEVFIEGLA